MTPLALPTLTAPASQPLRPVADPPGAPAPVPLSGPAATVRVEWAGAVRPPDALLRAFRPDLSARAVADAPTGPPPAFAANILDQMPDPVEPSGADGEDAAPVPGAADPAAARPHDTDTGLAPAEAAPPAGAPPPGPDAEPAAPQEAPAAERDPAPAQPYAGLGQIEQAMARFELRL